MTYGSKKILKSSEKIVTKRWQPKLTKKKQNIIKVNEQNTVMRNKMVSTLLRPFRPKLRLDTSLKMFFLVMCTSEVFVEPMKRSNQGVLQ